MAQDTHRHTHTHLTHTHTHTHTHTQSLLLSYTNTLSLSHTAMVKAQAQKQGVVLPPEGGWGWVVVGALFVVSTLVFGLIRSLGVFFVEFVKYFTASAAPR